MAIKVDNVKIVKYIIEHYKCGSLFDINEKDINDNIVMIKALENEEIFECLLQNGADVNTKDNRKNSLISLIMNNYPHLLNILLSYKNISINEKSANGNCPIIDAIIKNDFESIIKLISYGRKYEIDMNVTDGYGNTPLILSYKHGYMEIFNYLINHLNINEKDTNGFSILYYVIEKEDNETMNMLLNNNININNIDKDENSIFQVLINKGYKDILLDVMKNPEVKAYVDINHENKNGETSLSTIIENDNKDFKDIKENIIIDFLKLGYNVNLENRNGETVLALAIKNTSSKSLIKILKILIEYGSIINVNIILKSIEINSFFKFKFLLDYKKCVNLSEKNKISILENLFDNTFKYITMKNQKFINSVNNKYKGMLEHYIKYLVDNKDSDIIYKSGIIKKIIDLENIELLETLTRNGINLTIPFSNKNDKNCIPLDYTININSEKVFNYIYKLHYSDFYSNNSYSNDEYISENENENINPSSNYI